MKDLNVVPPIEVFWNDIQTLLHPTGKSESHRPRTDRDSMPSVPVSRSGNPSDLYGTYFRSKGPTADFYSLIPPAYRAAADQPSELKKLSATKFSWLEGDTYLNSQEEVFIRKTVQLICRYLSDPQLDVSFLAERLYLSSSQLNRRMQATIRQSTGNLIRNIRLQYAARLLLNNVASVGEISAEVGYQNQASFCRSFKKKFGCAPSHFSELQAKDHLIVHQNGKRMHHLDKS